MDPSDNSLADKCSTRLTDAPEIPQDSAASRWGRFWCGVMGWHPTRQREHVGFDGASVHARCRRCGFVGMEDSTGSLF